MDIRINPGIITPLLKESKDFYVSHFGMSVKFETEWFVLLETKQKSELAFMLPGIKSFDPLFRKAYSAGIWLTLNVEDIDLEYKRIKARPELEVLQEIKTETWGERHFVIRDPNNIALDIVQYVATKD